MRASDSAKRVLPEPVGPIAPIAPIAEKEVKLEDTIPPESYDETKRLPICSMIFVPRFMQ